MSRNLIFQSESKIFQLFSCLYVICLSRFAYQVLNNLNHVNLCSELIFSTKLAILLQIYILKKFFYNSSEIKMTRNIVFKLTVNLKSCEKFFVFLVKFREIKMPQKFLTLKQCDIESMLSGSRKH